jgi:AraC-like DNA-binding protein
MSNISLVTFAYVLHALEEHTGISKQTLLHYAGLDESIFKNNTSHVRGKVLSSVFQYCIQQSQDHTLPLKVGQSISYHSLGLLGYLMIHTSTLQQMIEKFYHYQKTIGSFVKFHLEKKTHEYKIAIFMNENPHIEVSYYHAEVHLSAIVSILSQILNVSVVPDKTCFSFSKIRDIEAYEAIFGRKICFGCRENSIVFNTKSLKLKKNDSNAVMLKYFENESKKILYDLEEVTCYSKVKKEILKSIGEYDISLDFIANKLNMNPRSLQYQLKEEKRTFRSALLQVRMHLAEHYIHNSTMDLYSIAFFFGLQ